MRYLSLFSGIEAASVAWKPLGWTCVAVAEIERFPCHVLKHHYPNVPNLGDVTKITKQQIEDLGQIDLVVLGFPCQDLSVAGKRKGLKNADGSLTRSGLFYTAMQIVEWSKARWTVGENVPGLFSSNEGRDFAAVVGELAGAEYRVPTNGWRTSGVALGPKGLVEWFVLDAQYAGLAQRRKRVFFVRDSSGQWEHRPPLFLIESSLCGHPAPSRQPRQRPVTNAQVGPGIGRELGPTLAAWQRGGGGLGTDAECDGGVIPIADTLNASGAGTQRPAGQGNETDFVIPIQDAGIPEVPRPLQERDAKGSDSSTKDGHLLPVTHALRGEGFDASEDGTGRGTPLVPTALKEEGCLTPELPQRVRIHGVDGVSPTLQNEEGRGHGVPSILAPTAFTAKDYGVDAQQDLAPTLRGGGHDSSHANGGVMPAIAFHENQRGEITTNETAGSLKIGGGKPGQGYPAVAFEPGSIARNAGPRGESHLAPTLRSEMGDNQPAVRNGMQVRRLTPIECARLQGFPDRYLYIHDKVSDGPMYKALGNSMAVPVMRWIGRRIELVESML